MTSEENIYDDPVFREISSTETKINEICQDHFETRKKFRNDFYKVLDYFVPTNSNTINKNVTIREGSLYRYNTDRELALKQLFRNYADVSVLKTKMENLSEEIENFYQDFIQNKENHPTTGSIIALKKPIYGLFSTTYNDNFVLLYNNNLYGTNRRMIIIRTPTDENLTEMLSMLKNCPHSLDPSLDYHITDNFSFDTHLTGNIKLVRKHKEQLSQGFDEIFSNMKSFIDQEEEIFEEFQQNISNEIVTMNIQDF